MSIVERTIINGPTLRAARDIANHVERTFPELVIRCGPITTERQEGESLEWRALRTKLFRWVSSDGKWQLLLIDIPPGIDSGGLLSKLRTVRFDANESDAQGGGQDVGELLSFEPVAGDLKSFIDMLEAAPQVMMTRDTRRSFDRDTKGSHLEVSGAGMNAYFHDGVHHRLVEVQLMPGTQPLTALPEIKSFLERRGDVAPRRTFRHVPGTNGAVKPAAPPRPQPLEPSKAPAVRLAVAVPAKLVEAYMLLASTLKVHGNGRVEATTAQPILGKRYRRAGAFYLQQLRDYKLLVTEEGVDFLVEAEVSIQEPSAKQKSEPKAKPSKAPKPKTAPSAQKPTSRPAQKVQKNLAATSPAPPRPRMNRDPGFRRHIANEVRMVVREVLPGIVQSETRAHRNLIGNTVKRTVRTVLPSLVRSEVDAYLGHAFGLRGPKRKVRP